MRLLKAPAAMIVVGALLVLPSLYTWYNVLAFWDPYEATGNLKVSVVNEDVGAENELTGRIDVGARVTEELLANDRLDFVAAGYDEAIADLEKGDVYAVYVIPENFSQCLISPLTGTVERPSIEYYANEKLGPVSPKITDTAATTLEETINSTFVATVSEAATKAIDDALNNAARDAQEARSVASARVNAALGALSQVQDDLSGARDATAAARAKVDAASTSMDDVSRTIADARAVAGDVSDGADATSERLVNLAADATAALPDVTAKAAQVEAKVGGIADDLASLLQTGQDRTGSAASDLESAADALESLASNLEDIANALPEGWSAGESASASLTAGRTGELTVGSLGLMASALEVGVDADAEVDAGIDVDVSGSNASAKSRILAVSSDIAGKANQLRKLSKKAGELDGQLADLSKAVSETASGLNDSAKNAASALDGYADSLIGGTVQNVVSALSRVSAACARVSATLSGLDATVGQVQSLMGQLSGLLGNCGDALSRTGGLVGGVQGDLDALASDVRLLADSSALADLLGSGNLNPESISAFLGAPTKVEKVEFYHPNAYGTAMAPLFMNLTFWIGAFMLVIIFRLEVDDEGLKRVTLGQRYLSRLLLFSGFAIVQALVCCAGVLALGVQVANVPALLLGSAFASLAYLGVIYALSVNLQYIGKAICIVLVFAQIPGGSGLYPLELTDGFFQAIYPFLPFSYGIGALREAIFGFYGNYFAQDIAVLAAIFISALALGMAGVPLMSNITRMVARQVGEGGLYNGEEASVPVRPLRLTQVLSAVADRDEYREQLNERYDRFSRRYPIMIRAAIVLGVVAPVALALTVALDAGEKVVLLTVFAVWLIALTVFLLVVESQRFSLERQLNIERMSNRSLVRLLIDRDRMESALTPTGGESQEARDA